MNARKRVMCLLFLLQRFDAPHQQLEELTLLFNHCMLVIDLLLQRLHQRLLFLDGFEGYHRVHLVAGFCPISGSVVD